MTMRAVVGLDIGRSAVKAVAYSNGQKYEVFFPSIVSRATPILDDRARSVAERETVEIEMKALAIAGADMNAKPARYFTGATARLHGDASSTVGLHTDWIDTAEYAVLVKSAKKRLAALNVIGLDDALVVVGTPSRHFQTQRSIMQLATYEAWPATIKVLSQPMGAYLSFLLDENGIPIKENMIDEQGAKRSWAVIDIGHYTTDFLTMKEGFNQQSKAESCPGISSAVSNLQRELLNSRGIRIDLLKAETVLREKIVKYMGSYQNVENEVANAIQPIADAIIQRAQSVFADDVGDLDGILLAGGAADIVFEPLNRKWRHANILENPRMAISEGYLRYAKAAAAEAAKSSADGTAA